MSTVCEKLLTDDRWLARALVTLNDRQTSDEQYNEHFEDVDGEDEEPETEAEEG